MRIRSGFVSNSSSTSFLIISKRFTEDNLLKLMGIEEGSPFQDMFAELFRDLMHGVEATVDLSKLDSDEKIPPAFGRSGESLTDYMMAKLIEARPKGLTAFYGRLDSETSPVQTFFCTNSFEEEGDGIYINGLDNTW